MAKPDPEELEAALEADPDAVEPYLVYSDLLQQQQDPRGDLIAYQHAGAQREADMQLEAHRHEILGLLDEHYHFLENVEWRLGYLHSVTVHVDDAHPATNASLVLRPLLASPSARVLRDLTVRYPTEDPNVMEVLSAEPRPNLKSLRLGPSGEGALDLDLGRFASFAPNLTSLAIQGRVVEMRRFVLPKLESLGVAAQRFELERIDLSQLRALSVIAEPSLAETLLEYVMAAVSPSLLRLRIGQADAPLFHRLIADAASLAELSHLVVEPSAAFLELDELSMPAPASMEALRELSRVFGERGRVELRPYYEPVSGLDWPNLEVPPRKNWPLETYIE